MQEKFMQMTLYWFNCFKSGKFDIKDPSRSDRPVIEKIDDIFTEIKVDRHISSHQIATHF